MDDEARAKQIMEDARNSIGAFCSEECKAYCCRKGYLVITDSQADLLLGERRKEFEQKKLIKKQEDGRHSLFLGDYNHTCPRLKDYVCTIHKNPNRPQACQDFPLFTEGKRIMLSPRCLAVKKEMLYPYVAELLAMGYELVKAPSFSDVELFACKFVKMD